MKKFIFILLLIFLLSPVAFAQETTATSVQLDGPLGIYWTSEDLRALAENYRSVSDRGVNFTPAQIDELKKLNPDLSVLRYLSATTLHDSDQVEYFQTNYPQALLYDAEGGLVPPLWQVEPGSAMGDPGSAQWRAYLIRAVGEILEAHYDGSFWDELLMAADLPPDFTGINPRTGAIYTTEDFRNDNYANMEAVKAVYDDAVFSMLNNIGFGKKYFQEDVAHWAPVGDGYNAEGWRGPSHYPVTQFLTELEWEYNLKMMQDIEEDGLSFHAATKYPREQWLALSKPEQEAIDMFHYTSFLLGSWPESSYSVGIINEANQTESDSPYPLYWKTDLGVPLGEYYLADGPYQRDFEKGKVLVNPTTLAVDLTLPSPYKTLDGEEITTVHLEPNTGIILLKI